MGMKALFIFAGAIILYFILAPIVDWYQKAKKEMEAHHDDRAE